MADIKVIGQEFTKEIEYDLIPEKFIVKEWRYIIVDAETGELLDDAQGYGYKTKQNAYKCWYYKHDGKPKSGKNKNCEFSDEELDNELFQMKIAMKNGKHRLSI